MFRCPVGWGVLIALLAATASFGQGGSFGPRPIYLRGSALAWQLDLDRSATEVFDLAVRTGKKHRLKAVSRDDDASLLRLAWANQKGSTLDKHCTYPIVSYYSWRPVENYASAQNTALTRRRPGETLGQAGRLNGTVHVTIRGLGDGIYGVQSICSAFLHEWGLLEATSLGTLEAAFLTAFLEAIGEPMEVPVPEQAILQPSREDPTRDLHVAQQCLERCTPLYRCAGMYVEPETRELRCVEETGTEADRGQ